jgi:hypothetical protein
VLSHAITSVDLRIGRRNPRGTIPAYHPGYNTNSGNSVAYQDGLQAGRSDSDRHLNPNARSDRWTSGQQLRDYQAGYGSGYDKASNRVHQGNGSVRIGSDHNIGWQGPTNGQVYVQVDNSPRKLFAIGASGTQLAPWMTSGHFYVFVLQDPNETRVHWHFFSWLCGFIPDPKNFNPRDSYYRLMIYWGFVALIEIASLAVVCWNDRQKISFF